MDRIQDQDEKIKSHLSRKERIKELVRTNYTNIDSSLRQIEENNMKNLSFNNTRNNGISNLQGSLHRAAKI